jgi:hypothetical protein
VQEAKKSSAVGDISSKTNGDPCTDVTTAMTKFLRDGHLNLNPTTALVCDPNPSLLPKATRSQRGFLQESIDPDQAVFRLG